MTKRTGSITNEQLNMLMGVSHPGLLECLQCFACEKTYPWIGNKLHLVRQGEGTWTVHCSVTCSDVTEGQNRLNNYLQDVEDFRVYREGLIRE